MNESSDFFWQLAVEYKTRTNDYANEICTSEAISPHQSRLVEINSIRIRRELVNRVRQIGLSVDDFLFVLNMAEL